MSPFLIIAVAIIVVVAAYLMGVAARPGARTAAKPKRSQPLIIGSPPARIQAGQSPELQALVGWLLSQAFEQTGVRVADDKVAHQRIVEAAEKAIEELKERDSVSIALPFLTADSGGPKHFEARVTQAIMRELIRY